MGKTDIMKADGIKGVVILFSLLKPKKCLLALLGSAILAFGLYNVHALSGVTEGGVLGMTLLLHHWFGISPAVTGLVLNAVCYWMGWRLLGKEFIGYSIIAGGGFSLFYALFEQFDPIWPQLAQYPLLAAVLGALFVGIGVGLSVRAGGAPGGDDAPGYEHVSGHALEHSVGLPDHRSGGAGAVGKLYRPQAPGLFPADGAFVRTDHRVCPAIQEP